MGNFDKKEQKKTSQQFIAIDQERQKEHSKKFKKSKKNKKTSKEDERFQSGNPGVIFISHLPHGFFEPQLKGFFNNFGDVLRLRLSRSKKTGGSKGYAYVEFSTLGAAETVAECMNGYLLFNHILKCEVVPYEKLHPATFKGSNRTFKKPFQRTTAIKRLNRTKTAKATKLGLQKLQQKNGKLSQHLQDLGIEYDLTQVRTDSIKPEDIKVPEKVVKKEEVASTSMAVDSTMNTTADGSGYFLIDEEEDEITFKIPPESANKVRYISRVAGKKFTKPKLRLASKKSKKTKVTKK